MLSNNFVATDGVERADSVDSIFTDIVPLDFVNAVAHLGPEHLVDAMNAAVEEAAMRPPATLSTGSNSRGASTPVVSYQAQQQHQYYQQQQHYNNNPYQHQHGMSPPTFFQTPPPPQHQFHSSPPQTFGLSGVPIQHHAPAMPGFVPLTSVSRSPSAVSSHSTTLLPTPANEFNNINTTDDNHQPRGSGPINAQLKRAHRRREDLRDTAFVEGTDRAVVAIPPRTPGRSSNNYPATPAYWANRGGQGGGGSENDSWQRQLSRRRGLTTPPVPRPDLPDGADDNDDDDDAENEENDKRRLRRLGGRSISDVVLAEEARKRSEMSEERRFREDLKRRVQALSEHYRREFSSTANMSPERNQKKKRGGGAESGLIQSDHDDHNDNVEDDDDDEDKPPRPGSTFSTQAVTPSERVFKSRAIRMAASDHKIIAASPEAKAEYRAVPRVKSPYTNLLSVSELDHFKPIGSNSSAVHSSPALKGTAAIAAAVEHNSVAYANRVIAGVDTWTRGSSQQRQRDQPPQSQQRSPPRMNETPTRRRPALVAGAQPVSVPLLEAGRHHDASSLAAGDDLSSPQSTALLERLMRQRMEMEQQHQTAATDITSRRAILS